MGWPLNGSSWSERKGLATLRNDLAEPRGAAVDLRVAKEVGQETWLLW